MTKSLDKLASILMITKTKFIDIDDLERYREKQNPEDEFVKVPWLTKKLTVKAVFTLINNINEFASINYVLDAYKCANIANS